MLRRQTKTELADELSTRDLPKTGNLDELIDRLVDADTKKATTYRTTHRLLPTSPAKEQQALACPASQQIG